MFRALRCPVNKDWSENTRLALTDSITFLSEQNRFFRDVKFYKHITLAPMQTFRCNSRILKPIFHVVWRHLEVDFRVTH